MTVEIVGFDNNQTVFIKTDLPRHPGHQRKIKHNYHFENREDWDVYTIDPLNSKDFDDNATQITDGVVADYSNTGYDFHMYSRINDVGK